MDFKPAFPRPVKWSTGENHYDQTGKNPTSLSLFVPIESAYAFAQYLINLADDETRHKTGKVWDYEQRGEVEVQGVYINGKGRDSANGSFGTINPPATKFSNGPADNDEVPF
ncbi:MAG: hypothetical protein VKM92_08780 [Cyanobacteriota bacterium]|nr:hypothetical protein [Cyanobacteriota bacterium]